MSAPLELERFELERLGAAVVVTTGVTTVVTTTCEVLVPETKLEVVTRVEGEEVVMTVLDAEVEEVVEVGVLEVEERWKTRWRWWLGWRLPEWANRWKWSGLEVSHGARAGSHCGEGVRRERNESEVGSLAECFGIVGIDRLQNADTHTRT